MRHALLAGWLALVVLVGAASPAHFWLDSGEIGSAGYELGVIHPPGAPGYALLLRAATVIPLGSIGFRMAALSSLLGAFTVGMVFAILRRRGAHLLSCWGASAWVLLGWTFLRHGRVVEIYAFAAALLVVVLWGFDAVGPSGSRTGRRLIGTFAAVWAALCFGDLRVALVLPVVVGWLVALRRGRPWARWAPLLVSMACSVLLCTVLASARAPMADWGDPDRAAAFWDHLTALSIRRAYAFEILPGSSAMWWHNIEAFTGQMAEDLGPVGPSAIVLALVVLWLRLPDGPAARRVAAGLGWFIVVEVVYAIGINPMGIDARQTGLVIAPLAALAVGEAMRRGFSGRDRLRWAVAPLVWTVLVLPAALVGLGDAATTRAWMPHSWTRSALEGLPPGTLVLMQSDDLAAGVAYAKIVEGARPDAPAIVAQHLYKPVPDALAHNPRVAKLWAAAAAADTEASRVQAVLATNTGHVAVEHAATTIFKQVEFWSDAGRLPLRLRGPSVPVHTGVAPAERAADLVNRWSARWSTVEDRERVALTLANYARALVRVSGDVDGAQAVLEIVLTRVWAEHVGTLVTLAALRDRAGRTDDAVVLTRRALALEPDRSVALTNLALYLSRNPATLPEALQTAERAAALRPWRADVWARLAGLREQAGDVDGAALARERARSASP